jgi:hypothetical protein
MLQYMMQNLATEEDHSGSILPPHTQHASKQGLQGGTQAQGGPKKKEVTRSEQGRNEEVRTGEPRKKKEVTRPELATTLLTMTRKNRTVRNAGHHP